MTKQIRSMNESQVCFIRRAAHLAKKLSPLALLVLGINSPYVGAVPAESAYPAMAPVDHYMMDPATEIALARTAAPASVSDKADILVLGAHGYKIAVKGTNGFVCYVGRSWENDIDNAQFWNPKQRAPECDNAAAARSVLRPYLQRTQWVLSKDGYIASAKGPWHPHVMFYGPPGPGSEWGANLPGSPVLSASSDLMPFTVYFVPVRKWSDGKLAKY